MSDKSRDMSCVCKNNESRDMNGWTSEDFAYFQAIEEAKLAPYLALYSTREEAQAALKAKEAADDAIEHSKYKEDFKAKFGEYPREGSFASALHDKFKFVYWDKFSKVVPDGIILRKK